MRIVMLLILMLDILNLLAFTVIAAIGFANGVTDPFPPWFRDGTDVCFYLGLSLGIVSLVCLAFPQQRMRAFLSGCIAYVTVIVILILTVRG